MQRTSQSRHLRDQIVGRAGALLAGALDWHPLALAALCAALTVICAQAPVSYAFGVGVERGLGSDEPFLQSFYPTEGEWPDGLFRWSRTEWATVALPGVGRRAVVVELDVRSHRGQHDLAASPTELALRTAGPSTVIALRPEARHYAVLLPPEALPQGALDLRLDTPAWQNRGDSRDELGVALGGSVRLWTVRGGGPVLPDLAVLVGLPLAAALLWAAARICGFAGRAAALLTLPAAIGAPLLALLDAPRLGFAGRWAPPFALIAVAAAAAAAAALPPLLRRLGAPASPAALRWLALTVALTFALKYGGRLYPDAMPGDWQLHINRFTITALGDLSIQAKHRGLPFPFPPGYYIDIAPLTLVGVAIRPLLPILAGLWEAASIPVIYAVAVRGAGGERQGLLAAAIYAATATGFMNTWFSFHTQVSTQLFTALLAFVLVAGWPRYDRPAVWWGAVFLLAQQFLGHIGTFINAGLLGGLAVAWLFVRGRAPQARALLLAGLAAGGFAVLCFYTLSAGLIAEQVSGVATRGLVEVSGKRPLDPATHLQVLWEGGLITHYGLFPVMLAVPGALAIARRRRAGALPLLVWGTFAVSAAQALVPFATRSAIQTRWLTFAAWAVAVAGAAGLALWLRRGRAARVAALAMGAYVIWITLVIVVQAMALRLPPIEPF